MEIKIKYNYLVAETGLEIGSRDTPFINLIRKDLLPEKAKVFFIDKRWGWLTNLRRVSRQEKEGVVSLGQELPFEKESISLIFVKDFFGAHGYAAFKPDWSYEIEDVGDMGVLIKEFYRVCKSGGKIIVMEISTPPEIEKIINKFEKQGFVLNERLEGVEALNILEQGRNLQNSSIDESSFSLVFKKSR